MNKILELFGGIGACSKALERLGIEHEIVDYVEIDKYAVKSFNAIHGTNFEPQDITTWGKDIEVDLIMHGSPCQDFSLAGKQAGADKDSGTRSSLLYETVRIVGKLKPKYVIWENVKNVISKKHKHNFDNYLQEMEQLGYTNYYQVLNAKDYGIPQNRERVFVISILKESVVYDDYNSNIRKDQDTIGTLTTNCGANAMRNGWKIIEHNQTFQFPPKQELKLRLKDMLEDEVDEKYYLSEDIINKITIHKENENCIQWDRIGGELEMWCRGWRNISPTVNTKCQNTKTILNEQPLRIRKLTPKECWRLMGFDDTDFEKASKVNSNTQLYKQAGNSIVVNVLEAILKELL